MREILFRGKRVDNGEWITGNYVKAGYHWHKYGKHEDWIATSAIQNGGFINLCGRGAVIPETVGQFTGLTDKNGVKIFEGDVVYNRVFKAQIELINGRFSPFGGDTFFADECEVIGNIHDNKELLEDKKQWLNSK